MKYILIIFLLLFHFKSNAQSIQCEFEEVYKNGEMQKGKLLFMDDLLRYQYLDKQLFTIIYNKNYFLIRNDNVGAVTKIDNDPILEELSFIIKNYISIQNSYSKNDVDIKIEKSSEFNFLKRIAIKSLKLNMSIYFNNCTNKQLTNKYFQPFALIEIS